MSLDKQHWTFYKYQLLVTHAMIAWHIKMEKLMVNAWKIMDISCVQSKIRHCDVYFECIYGIIEPSVFVEYGEIQYFSEYPKHIKY